MRKSAVTISIVSLSLIGSACANSYGSDEMIVNDDGNTINIANKNDLFNKKGNVSTEGTVSKYGYVRHQKNPAGNGQISMENMYSLNRKEMADIISELSVTLPKVNDCAALVTDEEVLVSYTTNEVDEQGRFEVADQVKKTALSVLPRWYHVYVTDDKMLMRDVENLAPLSSNSEESSDQIDNVIRLMLESSPQGQNVESSNEEMSTDMKYKEKGPARYDFTKQNMNR
ncbi:YhcN/YlaJ family sporulation lipoprotein [Bacillus spongiae]|uniref:YhcN/YlaJ family sporulation lipoprotein n=1 Tax=Bacillus spongiae TaxID=2683610 RepID=A0ABU8HF97_9BACI